MKIIFLQLNEINFELVDEYIKNGYNLDYLKNISSKSIDTFEEETYENLEPWIQWFSIFKGKLFKDHHVFRLGDGLKYVGDNIFSDITQKVKLSCGAIAPMNISSKKIFFDFFFPDPWSNEKVIGDFTLKLINDAIKQGINDNSGNGLNFLNKIKLILGLIFNLKIKDLKKILKFYTNIKGLSFRKALFLDLILVLLQKRLTDKNKTQFTSIFLNGGAHIQHHYFFNSKVIKKKLKINNPSWYIDEKFDPLAEALLLYNKIIKSYEDEGYKIILMTGLQQVPFNSIQYYYRLSDHEQFFKFLGIKIKKVLPRMTRDFEILFDSNKDRNNCANKLKQVKDKEGIKAFEEIELRDKSIFASLTYKKEINKLDLFKYGARNFNFYNFVNFVAIKNGKHHKKGKLFISDKDLKKDYSSPIELSKIRSLIFKDLQNSN